MKKKLGILISSLASLLAPAMAFADGEPLTWFEGVISRFLNIVVWPIFFGVSILMFIYAGFIFVTANGEPSKVATARKMVLFAVIGIIIAILAFSAVGIIQNVISPSETPTGSGGTGENAAPGGGGGCVADTECQQGFWCNTDNGTCMPSQCGDPEAEHYIACGANQRCSGNLCYNCRASGQNCTANGQCCSNSCVAPVADPFQNLSRRCF